MEIYSSKGTARFIVTILLILQITATSSIGESASEKDLLTYVKHHSSTQIPRTCQIYSKSTKKHIQIFNRKILANGDDGDEHSKVQKTSHRIGVVSIRGMKTGRYLCVSKRGKLVAKKLTKRKLERDNSCKFVENITSTFWTYFRSEREPAWYIGFNGKNGKAKKGKRTGVLQEACNFLIRDPDSTRHHELPTYIKALAEKLREKIQNQKALTRRRRHRFQTVDPIGAFDDIPDEVIDALPHWITTPPTNASPEDMQEWFLLIQNFIKNYSGTAAVNSTLNAFDLSNFDPEPATPDPMMSTSLHRSKSKGNGRSRKAKNNHKRSKGKNKDDQKEGPTVIPSRRKMIGAMVPKTPTKIHKKELTEPPTLSSPLFDKVQRRSRKRLATSQANSKMSTKVLDNHSETNGTSGGEAIDSHTNVSNNISNKENTNILTKVAVTHSRRSKARSRRGKNRPRRTRKTKSTSS